MRSSTLCTYSLPDCPTATTAPSPLPHVIPDPMAIMATSSPRLMRPERSGLIQRDGQRGGRGVAVLVEVDPALLQRHLEPLHALPPGCGMLAWWTMTWSTWCRCQPMGAQRLLGDVRQRAHRALEDLAPVHHHLVALGAQALLRHRLLRAAARDGQDVRQRAVRAQVGGQDAPLRLLGGRQHHRPGPVTKEDTGVAVRPVDDLGEQVRADDECPLHLSRYG